MNVKELDLEKSKFKSFSQKEQLGKTSHLEHPLFQVPGVTAKTCRGDPMHILFCKGLYGHVIGSILHYLCWYEGPGKVCKERPSKRIGVIFDEIQQEYKSQVWSAGSQILSSACLQMLKSLGLEKPPWTAKQVKASICFQPWFLSWKRCLLGPKKKKRKKCYLQPRAWKSLWHCGMKQVHSSPLLNFQKAWLLEKNSCWPTNG